MIDAGSGIVPLGKLLLQEKVSKTHLLFTHYHHDHTQGLLLCPATYNASMRFDVYGPQEEGFGPKQMLEHIMRTPFHPVNFKEVAVRFSCYCLEVPTTIVLVFHPEGGVKKVAVHELDGVQERVPSQIAIGKGRYNIAECLVVRMLYSYHPERTISYRFEERTTGNVFVFLTDHENLDQTPVRLRSHLKDADLLVMDSQYSRGQYDTWAAGFGHGTPDYCVRTAKAVGAARLGLTHHDPLSTDEVVREILDVAQNKADRTSYGPERVFVCQDYLEVEGLVQSYPVQATDTNVRQSNSGRPVRAAFKLPNGNNNGKHNTRDQASEILTINIKKATELKELGRYELRVSKILITSGNSKQLSRGAKWPQSVSLISSTSMPKA